VESKSNPFPFPEESEPSFELKKLQRRGKQVAAVLGGITFGALLIAIGTRRSPIPSLDAQRFHEAQRFWESHGPPSYEIEIRVEGRQAAVYRTEVRQGEVLQATRNEQPLRQQRTMGTWSVPGMFGTILSDVENQERHRTGSAGPETPRVAVRCAFDAVYGFPTRYHRTEMTGAENVEVTWEVLRFSPL